MHHSHSCHQCLHTGDIGVSLWCSGVLVAREVMWRRVVGRAQEGDVEGRNVEEGRDVEGKEVEVGRKGEGRTVWLKVDP